MRITKRLATLSIVALATFLMAAETQASNSYGSWGGSWGSGSSGALYGSHGGPIRNLIARRPVRNMLGRIHGRLGGYSSGYGSSGYGSSGYGSSGGYRYTRTWGSSGGSWGSHGSNGSSGYRYGSSGGSWGTQVVSTPVVSNYCDPCGVSTPVAAPVNGVYSDPGYYNAPSNIQTQPTPADGTTPAVDGLSPPNDPTPQPENTTTTFNQLRNSTIDVRLPSDAVVYVNGKRTKSKGEVRSFVSRNQKPGRTYQYEIKAVKDGQTKVESFKMVAGSAKSLVFDFDQVVTTVALDVPVDAKVVLAGNATNREGQKRVFDTKRLDKGETWKGYTVEVIVKRDGKEIVRRKTIDVVGGERYALAFDFDQVDANSVAAK